jgi:hypothetical protein
VVLDLRGEAKEGHDLGHACARDPFPPCDLGLGPDLAGVKLAPPLPGLSEELDHPRRLRLLGRLGRPPGIGGHVHDAVSGDPPSQSADAPVFERPLWPKGDLNGLFV